MMCFVLIGQPCNITLWVLPEYVVLFYTMSINSKRCFMSDVVQVVNNASQGILLSEAATQHVLNYLAKQAQCKGIRFSVKKTGCSGLSYVVDYVDQPSMEDVVLPLKDNYQVYIDKKSYPYIKGLYVDYVKQGLNYKFTFTNPNQTGQCGCGESFTVG